MKETNRIYMEDCMDGLREIDGNSIDAVVTDPPYGLSFMNKDWDKGVPDIKIWKECFRVLKPGAFALVMSAPRMDVQTEMALKLKEAGFRLEYTPIYWYYLSGFPKAMNISKAVDKKLGVTPDNIGIVKGMGRQNPDFNGTNQGRKENYLKSEYVKVIPTSEEAKKLDGSYAGFQPKPAVEVIIVAMKPLSEKTYVEQAMKNGKGITWLDDCRIPYQSEEDKDEAKKLGESFIGKSYDTGVYQFNVNNSFTRNHYQPQQGRFPANLLVSDAVLDIGMNFKSGGIGGRYAHDRGEGYGFKPMLDKSPKIPIDEGDLSRYFSLDAWWERVVRNLPKAQSHTFPFLYVPKPSQDERNKGVNTQAKTVSDGRTSSIDNPFQRGETLRRNTHPTVKPIKLMSYLITMITRPGDVVLDPFIGSGTTAVAARLIGRKYIGFENSREYYEIAMSRLYATPFQETLDVI